MTEKLGSVLTRNLAPFAVGGGFEEYRECLRCGGGMDAPNANEHSCCSCGDSGFVAAGRFIRTGEPGVTAITGIPGRRVVCDCGGVTEREDQSKAYARMRLPMAGRLANCTLENWQPNNGLPRIAAQNYVNVETWPPPVWLLYTGLPGRGKTHLGLAILKGVYERHGIKGQFWPEISLLDRLRATQNHERATETIDDAMERLLKLPLLVLDELGRAKATEFVEEKMYALINGRYNAGAATVFTTNESLTDLEPRVRSRVASGVVVECGGHDRRLAS